MNLRITTLLVILLSIQWAAFGKSTNSRITPASLKQGRLTFHIVTEERTNSYLFTVSITSDSGRFAEGTDVFPGVVIALASLNIVDTFDSSGKLLRHTESGTDLRKLIFKERNATIDLSFSVSKSELENPNIAFRIDEFAFQNIGGMSLPYRTDSHYAFLRDFLGNQ